MKSLLCETLATLGAEKKFTFLSFPQPLAFGKRRLMCLLVFCLSAFIFTYANKSTDFSAKLLIFDQSTELNKSPFLLSKALFCIYILYEISCHLIFS